MSLDLPAAELGSGAQLQSERWWSLSETARAQVLGLLAGLIARGVLADEPEAVS